MIHGRGGKDRGLLLLPCLHISTFPSSPAKSVFLPRTSGILFQQDLYLCLNSIPRPQWTLPGSPLWSVVLGTYHFKEGV